MASIMTMCEVCQQSERPCMQRRDGTFACGPCLKNEWERVKNKLVNQAANRNMGREWLRKKRVSA